MNETRREPYSFQQVAGDLLYAQSHRHGWTYQGLWLPSYGTLATWTAFLANTKLQLLNLVKYNLMLDTNGYSTYRLIDVNSAILAGLSCTGAAIHIRVPQPVKFTRIGLSQTPENDPFQRQLCLTEHWCTQVTTQQYTNWSPHWLLVTTQTKYFDTHCTFKSWVQQDWVKQIKVVTRLAT